MGPKVLNQPLDVESAKLAAPPMQANGLATSRQLLTMWKGWGFILDHESGEKYHLAFYHPELGWCACRWDEEHGAPFYVLPTSGSAIWVSTHLGKLIYISVGDEVGATMLASVEKSLLYILHADVDNLWIGEEGSSNIMRLRLQKEGLTIVNEKTIPSSVYSMYPLEDGAWVVVGTRQIHVFQSPLLEKQIYHEDKGVFSCYPPFLVRKDENFYYTEDPRRGWKKMPIAVENNSEHIALFAKHDDIYYAAVHRYQVGRTLLYRFSGESETDAEYMWEISGCFHLDRYAMYNGLVCIAEDKPLVISRREDVPENQGFLVWDPYSNTFHKDIPQFSVMHARSIIPRNLQIPTAWSDRGKGQEIQGAR